MKDLKKWAVVTTLAADLLAVVAKHLNKPKR